MIEGTATSTLTLVLLLTGSVLASQNEKPLNNAQYQASTEAYVLGADDQIVIRAFEAEEISDKPVVVGPDGLISLPLIGRLPAGGRSVRELEKDIASKLSRIIQHPSVSITITEYRSQPVSVLGEINNAGVLRLHGETTLLETLSLAGGLKQDAGYRVRIVRRLEEGPIPLAGAGPDSTGRFNVADVSVKDLLEARHPENNIVVKANDVITVPRGQLVYVVGEVNRAGGFILNEQETMSVLQAISHAEGLKSSAAAAKARVLRPIGGTADKEEIMVDVARVLRGAAPDLRLRPDDVLFIPNNVTKSVAWRSLEAAFNIGTGIAIWRP